MPRFSLMMLSHSYQPRGTPAVSTTVFELFVPPPPVLSASSVSPSPFAPHRDRATPKLRDQEIVFRRHIAAISTSNDYVAGHTMLSHETLAETLKTLEREYEERR